MTAASTSVTVAAASEAAAMTHTQDHDQTAAAELVSCFCIHLLSLVLLSRIHNLLCVLRVLSCQACNLCASGFVLSIVYPCLLLFILSIVNLCVSTVPGFTIRLPRAVSDVKEVDEDRSGEISNTLFCLLIHACVLDKEDSDRPSEGSDRCVFVVIMDSLECSVFVFVVLD